MQGTVIGRGIIEMSPFFIILNTHVYYDKYSKYEIIPTTSKGLNSKTNISVVWG
jgi:hypothetical protein